MSCRKVGLMFSRSRSQQRVKMSVFVQMISPKQTNILLPNLVLPEHAKRLVCYFKVKVTARVHMIMTFSIISSEMLILLLSNLV